MFECNKIEEASIVERYIGQVYIEMKDPKALQYLEKAYADFSNDPNFLFNLILASVYNKEPQKANEYTRQLKALNPGYPGLDKVEAYIKANI
ncbi:MAG: hypothetical protein HC896_18095 [Bacteroidales bacterium]|nr:hypothetical protein [Bacteroidales bacterium]